MLPACDLSVVPRAKEPEPQLITAFGPLARNMANELERISYTLLYPSGSVLYAEGDTPRGIFIIASGRVKLSVCSGDGRTLILRLADPGDVVGLPGTLSGNPYEVTAQAIGACRIAFIKRDTFLSFMNTHREVALAVCEHLRRIYTSACFEIRRIGLSHSSCEKLAKLLVEWPATNGDTPNRIRFAFGHDEVGQMIGSSRETVSRAFAKFRKKGLAEIKGSILHIHDRTGLEAIASGVNILATPRAEKARSKEPTSQEAYPDEYFHPDGV